MKIFQVLSKWTDKSLEVPIEITLHKTFDNKEKAEEFSKELFQKLLKEFKSMFPTKFLLMGDYNQDFLYTNRKGDEAMVSVLVKELETIERNFTKKEKNIIFIGQINEVKLKSDVGDFIFKQVAEITEEKFGVLGKAVIEVIKDFEGLKKVATMNKFYPKKLDTTNSYDTFFTSYSKEIADYVRKISTIWEDDAHYTIEKDIYTKFGEECFKSLEDGKKYAVDLVCARIVRYINNIEIEIDEVFQEK